MSEPSFDANKLRPLFADLAEDGPGGVLAVIRGGEVILHHAFGMANVEHQVANACDTVFYIASTSKQFVGTAITLLESEGLVDLEAEVRDFLPELHAFDPALRVFHLLHHTSGLRDKYALAAVGGLGEETYATDAGSRELIFAQRTLNFEPGSRMMYSNSNYFLLAQIVERVSGTGFEEFTRERIFEPLGMSDTRFRSDSSVVIPGRASGYRKGGDGTWRLAEYTMNSLGPGGVVTTVDDLAKWSSVFFGKGGLGLPDLADRLTRTRSLTDGKPNGYALGLMLGEHLGRPTVSHGGGVGGFSAELIHFAEDDLSVACLCNTSAIPAGALARRAATILLDLPGANASKAPKADGELASPDPRFAGVFASPDGDMVLRVEIDDDAATIAVGGSRFPAAVAGVDTLIAPGDSEIRLGDQGLEVTGLGSTEPSIYRRLVPGSAAAGLPGRYRSKELDVTLSVAQGETRLEISWPRGRTAGLEDVGSDVFLATSSIMGIGMEIPVKAVTGDDGSIVALELSTSRALNNRFDRVT